MTSPEDLAAQLERRIKQVLRRIADDRPGAGVRKILRAGQQSRRQRAAVRLTLAALGERAWMQ